jgi:RNA polymerase sigma-70 factor, ECF subfamily
VPVSPHPTVGVAGGSATPQPHSELVSLVMRARRGDRAAFERIVHVTARVVYAQIVAQVRDRQKAEDLTQETYVAAWKGIGSVYPPSRDDENGGGGWANGFIGWLLTVARNQVLDAAKFDGRKKRHGSPSGQDTAGVADSAAGPLENAQQTEARDQALRVLEELPEDYRRVLTLRYLAGADYAEIRRQLDLSDGALRGLLNRGMALLRERMTKLER